MKRLVLLFLIIISTEMFAIDGVLIKTIDYSFGEKWNNTLGTSIPKITTCEKVYKSQEFYITVIAGDYKLDKNQVANVVYSITIKRPDNSIYFSKIDLPLINQKIGNPNNLQMSNSVLKNSFKENDVLGTYQIEIEIKDLNANTSKKISTEINLVKALSFAEYKVIDNKQFQNWFGKYYEKPKPEEAISYYLYYSKSTLSENDSALWPILSFFKDIFENNTFLYPEIINAYKSEDLKTKIYLLYLLEYSKLGKDDFYSTLTGDEKQAYLKIKDLPVEDLYGPITSPNQLDMLWGAFTASGSYKPILKLIQTLDYAKFKDGLAKYEKSARKSDEEKEDAIKNAIFNSLVWSIESNCEQHELVLNYCNWAYNYGDLNDTQKLELGKILNK